MFSLCEVFAVDAIRTCCWRTGACDESCCDIWEMRCVADETVDDILAYIMIRTQETEKLKLSRYGAAVPFSALKKEGAAESEVTSCTMKLRDAVT